jgi:hypothetical protein
LAKAIKTTQNFLLIYLATGFDGIAKRSGALRLRAACANLNDLLEASTTDLFEAPGGPSAAKPFNTEEIRLIL